jgi:two-component system, chemotaxis family, protein-glutamate methylesterase/glutaminase
MSSLNNRLLNSSQKVIAMGASTGGTEAIREILANLPVDIPPVLIVQHMPESFIKAFAERLNGLCAIEVKEAEDQEPATVGKALIAPGNKHMTLNRGKAGYYVEIKDGPLVFHQRPSVEVLFTSVAGCAGPDAIGIILTGMGKDGATGLLAMKNAGALTIAQDKTSCVVFGMSKEAIAIGAALQVIPLENIAPLIVDFLGQTGKKYPF